MKKFISFTLLFLAAVPATRSADSKSPGIGSYFIDVQEFVPGHLTVAMAAEAHRRDVAVQQQFEVVFIDYWVDEAHGLVYGLSQAKDAPSITSAHRAAQTTLPARIMAVSPGETAAVLGGKRLFLDVHELGAGNVTAAAVAAAHQKDLEVEARYGVNFITYWVDELNGKVVCLSEASSADDVRETHRHAHGLLPASISEVKTGN